MSLLVCTSCHRHVRSEESDCPFCGAEMEGTPRAIGRPLGRLSRAAVFAFGVSAGTVACGDSHSPDDASVGEDAGSANDAGSMEDAAMMEDAGPVAPDANVAPPYGLPPPDDAGGAAPLYGGAPER